MPRPFTDIQAAVSGNPVKNGTSIASATFTGTYSKLDTYVKNVPEFLLMFFQKLT